MKQYKITYHQEYNGETLKSSYVRSVENESEVGDIIGRLYSDPHVYYVDVEEIIDEEEPQ